MSTGELRQVGPRAFGEFVAATQPALLREARRHVARCALPRDVTADDLVQTAYVRLLPAYDALPSETAAFSYAVRTIEREVRALADYARRRGTRWLSRVHNSEQSHGAPSDERIVARANAAAVHEGLRGLSARQRRAVALVDLHEVDHADAAAFMGVSEKVLKGLLQRGRASLRAVLERNLAAFAALGRVRGTAVAASPVLTVVAAFCLTVWHTPALPPSTPYGGGDGDARPLRPIAVPQSRVRPPTPAVPSAEAAPATTPAPVPPPRAIDEPSPTPSATKTLYPGVGACVGDDCTWRPAGDELCVWGEEENPALCANQRYVGVCPIASSVPHTTCRRYDRPTFDPTPAPP